MTDSSVQCLNCKNPIPLPGDCEDSTQLLCPDCRRFLRIGKKAEKWEPLGCMGLIYAAAVIVFMMFLFAFIFVFLIEPLLVASFGPEWVKTPDGRIVAGDGLTVIRLSEPGSQLAAVVVGYIVARRTYKPAKPSEPKTTSG